MRNIDTIRGTMDAMPRLRIEGVGRYHSESVARYREDTTDGVAGWGDLLDVITGKATDDANAVDAKIMQLNADRVALGAMTQAQADAANAALLSDNPEGYRRAVGDAAMEGAMDGLAAEQQWVKETLGTVVGTVGKGVLGFVPWWVWVGGGAYVAYRLGAFDNLLKPAKARWSR